MAINLSTHIEQTGTPKAAFARKLNISPGTLADFLSGRRTPGLSLAVRIEHETGGAVRAASWVSQRDPSTIPALLAGRKTQTRRIIGHGNTLFNGGPWTKLHKDQTWDWAGAWVDQGPSPSGNPGPYLKLPWMSGDADPFEGTVHRLYPIWRRGDQLTDVRVQRLQEITNEDAEAEGCPGWYAPCHPDFGSTDARLPWEEFRELWNSIHGIDAWAANPWVVAISFTVARAK